MTCESLYFVSLELPQEKARIHLQYFFLLICTVPPDLWLFEKSKLIRVNFFLKNSVSRLAKVTPYRKLIRTSVKTTANFFCIWNLTTIILRISVWRNNYNFQTQKPLIFFLLRIKNKKNKRIYISYFHRLDLVRVINKFCMNKYK